MAGTNFQRIIFIINKKSGDEDTDWEQSIQSFFKNRQNKIHLYFLPDSCDLEILKKEIKDFAPQLAVAVGGDGTVKLVAESILDTDIVLGILPAGSANGMAKELNIDEDEEEALKTLLEGKVKKIHLTKINEHLCIHLADVGFNAYLIKKFEIQEGRGMWGYFKAALKVLFTHTKMHLTLKVKGKLVDINAAMIVIANATCYGSGALINPDGSLEDDLFEVIAVKKISLPELFKMAVTHAPYNREKTEVFHTDHLVMQTTGKVHFQVDGEYLGKVSSIKASILSKPLPIVVPW
jgi:diacylglycerol kinase (ATP)